MKLLLIIIFSLSLSACISNKGGVKTTEYTTELNATTFNSPKLIPGKYLLANITNPREKSKLARIQFPYLTPLICATHIENNLSDLGFERVFSQVNARYIVWFSCQDSFYTLDNGYKAIPNYDSKISFTDSNGTVSDTKGGTINYRTKAYGTNRELSSIDISKSKNSILSRHASITFLEKSRNFSSKLRYPVWSGDVYWHPNYESFKAARAYLPFKLLIGDIFSAYDTWETFGQTAYTLDNVRDTAKIKHHAVPEDYWLDMDFETDVHDKAFVYTLKHDAAFRVGFEENSVSGSKGFKPWIKLYESNGRLNHSVIKKPDSVQLQTTSLQSEGISHVIFECHKDKPSILVKSPLINQVENEVFEGFIFENFEKKPSMKVHLVKIDDSDRALMYSEDDLLGLVQSLRSGKGRIRDFIELYFPDTDAKITIRKEGFNDFIDDGFSSCIKRVSREK